MTNDERIAEQQAWDQYILARRAMAGPGWEIDDRARWVEE